jgi:hypothetical protein
MARAMATLWHWPPESWLGIKWIRSSRPTAFRAASALALRSFRGTPVSVFVPFAEKFREQFYMNKPAQYRFKHEGKVMRVTFFLVEGKTLLGAMFEDITTPVVRREAVIEKAEEVITKSLNTVQQIASLLGENAAETEIVMNSIIEEFNVHSDNSSDHGLVEESDGNDK